MKYLVLNGSPKKNRSVTMLVANEFIQGIKNKEPDAEIEIIHLADCNIKPCRSCYACWSHLFEGECVMTRRKKDDMTWIMEKYHTADKFILVTPMHFFAISSYLQKFLERTFGLIKAVYLPVGGKSEKDDADLKDMSTRDIAVISTCKVYFDGVWDSIDAQMSLISRRKYQRIFSTQPLAMNPEDKEYVNHFFKYVHDAGAEFAETGKFTEETKEGLETAICAMSSQINTSNVGL